MRRAATTRLVRVVLLMSVAALVGLGNGWKSPPASAAADIGLPFFGVTLGTGPESGVASLAAGASAGFASAHVSWSELEPTPGAWDTTVDARYDALIGALAAAGVKPIVYIGAAPGWAAVHPNGPLRPGQTDAYLSFVERIVNKYRVAPYSVRHWLLWSEPDAMLTPLQAAWVDRGAWGDSPAEFASVMRQVYGRIKAADSNAIVIVGPLAYDWFYDPALVPTVPDRGTGGSSPGFNAGGIFKYSFLDNVLLALQATPGGPAFDAVGINAYIYFGGGWEAAAARAGRTGVDVAAKVGDVRRRLQAFGVDVPIYIGESGFWSAGPSVAVTDGAGNDLDAVVTPSVETQAAYVPKLYARGRAADVAGVAWFSLEEIDGTQKYGLVDTGGPKPAYRAYRWAATVFSGVLRPLATTPALVTPIGGSVEEYGFTGTNGYLVVAWAKATRTMTLAQASAPTASVAVQPGLSAYDLYGNAVGSLGNDSQGRAVYNLTNSPVFFRSTASAFRYSTLVPVSPRLSRF